MADMMKCTKCERELGAANKTGICTRCQKPSRFKTSTDDSVLSRMGFGDGGGDEAPPASRKPKSPRAPKVPKPAPVPWREQFAALTRALGLDPDAMLEEHCRAWVEQVRSRALPQPVAPAAVAPAEAA